MRFSQLIQDSLLALWVGGLWIIGYIVTPVLFQTLSKGVAGEIAGQLFMNIYWIGLMVCLALLALSWGSSVKNTSRIFWSLLLVMAALTLVEMFVIHPWVIEVKQQIASGDLQAKRHFSILHASGSIIYLLMSLLGFALFFYRDKPASKGNTL